MEGIHIGSIIAKEAKSQKVTKAELARRINTTANNAGILLKRKSIHIDQLIKISKALGVNFFKLYCPEPSNTTHVKTSVWIEKEEMNRIIKDKLL